MPTQPSNSTAQYLEYLRTVRRRAPTTLVNYQRDLERLTTLVPHKDAAQLTSADLRAAMMELSRQRMHGKSISHALSVWRGYFEWLCKAGQRTANPAAGLRGPKVAKPLPKALSVEHAVQLVEYDGAPHHQHSGKKEGAPSAQTGLADLRDHAMVELLYSSGLRRGELVSLDERFTHLAEHTSLSWVDWEAAELHVIGKGSKRRIVPIGSKALAALHAWRAVRQGFLRSASSPNAQAALFLGDRGERLSAANLYTRVKAWSLRAGVPVGVHPHMLRHSAASHLLQSSGDLRAVQEFLGHANIATTQIYTKLDWQHLSKTYDAAHPRARRSKTSG